jgi:hypothetical protein
VCAVCSLLPAVRTPGAFPRRHIVPGLSPPRRSGGREEPVPSVRQTWLHPGQDRLVRVMFPAGAGEGTTKDLPKLR